MQFKVSKQHSFDIIIIYSCRLATVASSPAAGEGARGEGNRRALHNAKGGDHCQGQRARRPAVEVQGGAAKDDQRCHREDRYPVAKLSQAQERGGEAGQGEVGNRQEAKGDRRATEHTLREGEAARREGT